MNKQFLSQKLNLARGTAAALLGCLALAEVADAQPFLYQNNDLCLTFRKNAPYTENYEVVVDIGQASNYLNAAVGTTMTVPGFNAAQLVTGSFASLNNLSWAVVGWYSGSGYGTNYPANVQYTLWVTVPRTNSAVRSPDATRFEWVSQRSVRTKISSILANAAYVSHDLGTSNQFNTPSFIREAIATYPQQLMSLWMGSLNDKTVATLNDTWPPGEPNNGNLENTTPGTFSSAVRSDLYEVRPLTDGQLNPITDPHTGTSGLAYYAGYFQLQTDGTMTFTREEASAPVTPPPSPRLSISRSGNVSYISFVSSNTATYRLLYTNAAGLKASPGNWPVLSTTITGDGSTKTFQDTTTDATRVYRVQAQ